MGRPRVRDEALRDRLLAGALDLVESQGVPAVTTRAVAARANSSMPAVHELFGGKSGLVRAIFIEGFARLAADLSALPKSDDPETDVLELARAFRRFACNHPHLFEVMFSRPFAEFRPDRDDLRAGDSIHAIVMDRVSALLGDDTPPAVRKDAAISLFAVLHGLANLESAGILGSGSASIDRRWHTATMAAVHGISGLVRSSTGI